MGPAVYFVAFAVDSGCSNALFRHGPSCVYQDLFWPLLVLWSFIHLMDEKHEALERYRDAPGNTWSATLLLYNQLQTGLAKIASGMKDSLAEARHGNTIGIEIYAVYIFCGLYEFVNTQRHYWNSMQEVIYRLCGAGFCAFLSLVSRCATKGKSYPA